MGVSVTVQHLSFDRRDAGNGGREGCEWRTRGREYGDLFEAAVYRWSGRGERWLVGGGRCEGRGHETCPQSHVTSHIPPGGLKECIVFVI